MVRDFLICLSLANLWFIGTWYQLQKLSNPELYYYRKAAASLDLTFATAFVIIVLAGAGFVFARAVRRKRTLAAFRMGRCLFLLGCVVVLEGGRAYLESGAAGALILCVELVLVAVSVFWNRIAANPALAFVFILWPLYPIALGHQLFIRFTAGGFADKRPAAPVSAGVAKPVRAVWLIFDELDQRVAFERRPARLQMPHLDQLRQSSIYAPRAIPPTWRTLSSIPGLLTGERVTDAHEAGTRDLILTLEDGTKKPAWGTTSNLFSKAKRMGLRVGIVGYYHPYCRVLGEWADVCTWEESVTFTAMYPMEVRARSLTFLQNIWLVTARQMRAYPVLRRAGLDPPMPARFAGHDEYARELMLESFQRMRSAALGAIADPQLDLVFVHWRIPHLPGLISTVGGSRMPGYIDNLALMDRTVGQVQQVLEASGLWDRTLLLISSDHGFRPEEWREHAYLTAEDRSAIGNTRHPFVPLFLKLPGQEQGTVYDKPLDLIVAADLTLRVLSAEFRDAAAVTQWLDRARPKNRASRH